MTLLSTTTLSGATTTISSIDGSYNNLQILIQGITINTASTTVEMRPNAGNSSSAFQTNATNSSELVGPIKLSGNNAVDNTGGVNVFCVNIFNYASSTYEKTFSYFSKFTESAATKAIYGGGGIDTASAITSIAIACGGGRTFSGGQVLIYGVK